MRHHGGLAPARRILAIAIASAAVATSCGIPLDDSPRTLAGTPSTVAQVPVAESGDSTAFVFFIADNLLVNLDSEVPNREPQDVLETLFAGVPAGMSSDIVSQIPNGTRLLGVHRSGTVLDVDVSKEFDNLVGAGRTQATAQIVMTATDLGGIDEVGLQIQGQPTQVFSPLNGDSDRVGACDYLNLFPTDDVINSWTLDRKSQRHMITRRSMLLSQCGAAPSTGN